MPIDLNNLNSFIFVTKAHRLIGGIEHTHNILNNVQMPESLCRSINHPLVPDEVMI